HASGRLPVALTRHGAPAMKERLIVLALLATAAGACSSALMDPNGTGGSSGTTGTGGVLPRPTGGIGGGSGPSCNGTPPADIVALALSRSDGTAVDSPVSAPVSVVSIGDCASADCPLISGLAALPQTASRIVLAAAGSTQQWTLYLGVANLPSDL